jgi:primosomal protein N' (replication factor Y)
MREELKGGNRGIFSRLLERELGEVLARGEQAILFMNRRGTATYVFCRECGQALKCPRCDTPLTLHTERLNVSTFERSNIPMLLCHRCGYTRQMPKKCPMRGSISASMDWKQRGRRRYTGFLQARALRWDHDTTVKDA